MSKAPSVKMLGRYEILSELGQGAMGVVYKARDPMLDRIVAIKTINLTLPKQELAEYEARFYQEAKAAGGLSHRNIVTIHDIGRSERVAYMAMEFLEGQELRRLMQADAPIAIAQALSIGAQVAEGLQFAHDCGIVHRDIKPANIMVLKDGLVKITDFGIARMRTNQVRTMTGIILGSPKYMSPEQVSGKTADSRSDIFSLGVLLYEMLTGTSPFVADNIHGVMYQTMNFNPPAPKTLNPELPEALNFIIAKALAKNLGDRYQKAQVLCQDLRLAISELAGAPASGNVFSDPVGIALVAPASLVTGQQDNEARILDLADNVADEHPEAESAQAEPSSAAHESTGPALGLSNAFDSFDATMRLAAMTGMEKDLDRFSQTQKVARLKSLATAKRAAAASASVSTLSDSSTWRRSVAGAKLNSPTRTTTVQLQLIWIGSGLIAATAVVLFLLR